MQEIKPWLMLANGLDRVAKKLDRASEALGWAQMWCLDRDVHGEAGPMPPPQHFHHVHISGTWPPAKAAADLDDAMRKANRIFMARGDELRNRDR